MRKPVALLLDKFGKPYTNFLVQTHNMTTVNEIAEQCRQLNNILHAY